MNDYQRWFGSLFSDLGRPFLIALPLFVLVFFGIFLLVAPEKVCRKTLERRAIENDPDEAARVYRRCKMLGAALLIAALALLIAEMIVIRLGLVNPITRS